MKPQSKKKKKFNLIQENVKLSQTILEGGHGQLQ